MQHTIDGVFSPETEASVRRLIDMHLDYLVPELQSFFAEDSNPLMWDLTDLHVPLATLYALGSIGGFNYVYDGLARRHQVADGLNPQERWETLCALFEWVYPEVFN